MQRCVREEFLTQEQAFTVFNSLPGKLIFKTLLRSCSSLVLPLKSEDADHNPQDGVGPASGLQQSRYSWVHLLSSDRANPVNTDPLAPTL